MVIHVLSSCQDKQKTPLCPVIGISVVLWGRGDWLNLQKISDGL